MKNNSILPSSAIDSAISLEELGIRELAWKWQDIHSVIEFLVEHDYAILGGDVYLLEDDEKINTYDNWYLDKETETSWLEYVQQSKKVAEDYIERYHSKNGDRYCYSIIYSSEGNM